MSTYLAIFRLMVVFLMCSASSCFGFDSLGQRTKIIFEVCRPNHPIAFAAKLGYQAIGKSGYGGVWLLPNRKSETDEPVYYSYAENEADHVAIVAQLSDSKEFKFVFMRPSVSHLQLESWSSWLPPDFVTNDDDVEGKILRKIDFNKSKPESSSLLIRYKLMRIADYLNTITNKDTPSEVIEGGKCAE